MSLRRDIHQAFDGIAPSTFGMPERMVQAVLNENAHRRRKGRFMLRLRAPMSLVAVFMVVALIAAALIGGRLLRDWNSFIHGAPAGRSVIAALEARPVTLPVLSADATCPSTSTPVGVPFQFGSGPVYANGGEQFTSDWGYYYDVLWYTPNAMTGPVLVRGRDIRSDRIVVFVDRFSAGPIVGTDVVSLRPSKQHSEVVLDAANPQGIYGLFGEFHVRQGIAKGFTGCVGFQVDGATFSEQFIGFAPPA